MKGKVDYFNSYIYLIIFMNLFYINLTKPRLCRLTFCCCCWYSVSVVGICEADRQEGRVGEKLMNKTPNKLTTGRAGKAVAIA